MTTAAIPGARVEASGAPAGATPADVLVVFGITGDLAKVMTFRSLYRLERARPARLPDRRRRGRRLDASTTCASTRARAIVAHGRDARRGGVRALRRAAVLRVAATSATTRRTSASRPRSASARAPVFYLEIPPFLFGTVIKGLARRRPDRERARGGREAVRPRPRVRPRARRPSCTSTSTSRSCTGSTTSSGRWASSRSSSCASPTRCSSRSGTATTSRPCRSRWPRASASRTAGTSTTRSARCATSSSTT